MPDYANPQSLNRFSYVINNPLRYIDPTGHAYIIDDDKNGNPIILLPGQPPNGGGGGGGNNNDDDDIDAPAEPNLGGGGVQFTPTVYLNGSSYCGGGPNGLYNFFDCGANITQDLAVLIDIPFALLDAVLITAGCFAGPEGCLAGAGVADTVFNITGANADETVLSLISAGFSIAADLTNDGHLGQDSVISIVAAGVGFFSPDPILDLAIDGFGSAYNHEVNPIYGIFNH